MKKAIVYLLMFIFSHCYSIEMEEHMISKSIYLTIDDAPSQHTLAKVDYLQKNNIPAIFYCRGNAIEQYQDSVVEIIKAGFLVGNHSYSHPFFSKTPNEIFFDEILKTEKLIDECYCLAGIIRPCKVIASAIWGPRGRPTLPSAGYSRRKD